MRVPAQPVLVLFLGLALACAQAAPPAGQAAPPRPAETDIQAMIEALRSALPQRH